MTITCPKCGFTGGFGATLPSDRARAAGATSQAVDLLDSGKYAKMGVGELAICSHCETALVFAGWIEIDPQLVMTLSPEGRKMIQDGQEAIRRAKRDPDWNKKGNKL